MSSALAAATLTPVTPVAVVAAGTASPADAVRGTRERFRAPRRFDVHTLPAFDAWVNERFGTPVELVLADVVFMDHAVLDRIDAMREQFAAAGTTFDVIEASKAARITFELTAA